MNIGLFTESAFALKPVSMDDVTRNLGWSETGVGEPVKVIVETAVTAPLAFEVAVRWHVCAVAS